METVGFWSRVGHWFKRSGPAPGEAGEESTAERIGLVSGNEDRPARRSTLGPVAGDGSRALSRLRMSRPGPSLDRLAEEYGRVVNLIDAIQKHLASQAQQSEKMARSLDRLAEGLSHVPEASRKELALLAAISETVDADLSSSRRLEENLSQLPHLADAQRETMVSIDRHLDLSRETGERVAGAMGEVRHAVSKLGDATEASTKSLEEIHWDAAARDERLASLLELQTKRFAAFAWAALVLAVVASGVGLFALLR